MPKHRRWRMQQGGFEEVSRFSRRANGWKPGHDGESFCRYGQKVAGGKKEAVDKKYAAGDKRGKNCRGVGCRQHTIDEQGQVRLPPMVTKGGGERRRHSPPLDL